MKVAVRINRNNDRSWIIREAEENWKFIGFIVFDSTLGPPINNQEKGKSIEVKIC